MIKQVRNGAARKTAHIETAKRHAALVLRCETCLRAGWPLAAVVMFFLATALLTLPQSFGQISGGWGQLAVLIGFAMAAGFALRYFLISLDWPDTHAIHRRVEDASGMPHRPLTQMADQAVTNSPLSDALWHAHQDRLRQQSNDLRAGGPRPLLAGEDRFGIIGLAAVALAAGLIVGGSDGRQHLAEALSPNLYFGPQQPPPTIDVWINPPAYTGLTPSLLDRQVTPPDAPLPKPPAPYEIAIGSSLLAKVSGVTRAPVLSITNQAGQSTQDFQPAGSNSYQLTTTITDSGSYEVQLDGDNDRRWTLAVIADQQPAVKFAAPPSVSERKSVRIDYSARDDYGVTALRADVFRLDASGQRRADAPIEIEAYLPNRQREAVTGSRFVDLTPHPWAGLAVVIELVAEDALGQKSRSTSMPLTLPERRFQHPVAQAIIAQRQRLVRSPAERQDIAKVLRALAARPGDYGDDLTVFLGLKSASARLFALTDVASRQSVLPLLWETALRVENGALAMAEQRVQELEQKLQEALAGNADQAEIENLLDQLQDALDQYMRQLAEKMQELQRQNGQREDLADIDPQRLLRPENLQNMVKNARRQLRQGNPDGAKRMLSQLQQMMQNLRLGQRPQMSPQQRAMRELTNRLQELTRQQQSLMDQTYRHYQQGRQNSQNQNNPQGERKQGERKQDNQPSAGRQNLAETQEQVRRALGALMRALSDENDGRGEIPDAFGKAERAMKGAATALHDQQPGSALGPQGEALTRLREGGQQLQEQLRQGMAQGQNGKNPGQETRSGQGDPLRPTNHQQGRYGDGDLTLPTERQSQKVRDILNELQRRSGDQDRAPTERLYLDRLLKRF